MTRYRENLSLIEHFVHDLKARIPLRHRYFGGLFLLRYLKTFSVDYLKVDGEFIRNMGENGSTEKAIVKSIAELAENLGIKTIAEYVETSAILGEVKSTGIDYAQGYFIQRPSPDLP
jgi:EAL domain-containing protein (putative c-di-GMP-specific phosphodiesterase class I)